MTKVKFETERYPEETVVHKKHDCTYRIRKYGERSEQDRMALISHYFNNKGFTSYQEKEEANYCLREYIHSLDSNATKEEIDMLCENPFQLNLFKEWEDVPFHNKVNSKFKFIDLFAGIGGIRLPFTELGGKCVFSSEWDAAACRTYTGNFGEVPFGDITKIEADFIPSHDVLLAGFPCQAFSIMGKMRGFEDTRGTMFFEVARILAHHHPKAILLENVKQLVGHDKGKTFKVILETLSELGYYVKWKILNALDFGLPQKRERVIIVGFLNKEASEAFNFDFEKMPYNLADILEPEETVAPELMASDMIREKRMKSVAGKKVFYPSIWHENKSGNISVLPYACALRTGASYNYLLINGYRRPTSRELLRLQGFPESFRIVVPHSEIRRQTGNSVAVPMIRAVAQKMIKLI